MARRVSALSQVLRETQAHGQQQDTVMEQSDNTVSQQSDKTTIPQSSNTVLSQQEGNSTASPQNGKTVIPQNGISTLPQDRKTEKQQSNNTTKQQRTRKTDERDKVTYYLDPGQFDKLEELRLSYRKATGKRLNEQDFMRLIINRLDLPFLTS